MDNEIKINDLNLTDFCSIGSKFIDSSIEMRFLAKESTIELLELSIRNNLNIGFSFQEEKIAALTLENAMKEKLKIAKRLVELDNIINGK